jgi:hypothetical protein
LPLLQHDAIEVPSDLTGQDEVTEPRLRVGRGQESCEFASRLCDRDGTALAASRGISGSELGPVDEGTKLLGELAVPLASSVRGKLDHHREEAIVVALNVALQQGLELLRGGHDLLFSI